MRKNPNGTWERRNPRTGQPEYTERFSAVCIIANALFPKKGKVKDTLTDAEAKKVAEVVRGSIPSIKRIDEGIVHTYWNNFILKGEWKDRHSSAESALTGNVKYLRKELGL